MEGKLALPLATEDEKKLLRTKIARDATPEEVEAFLSASGPHLNDKAKVAFQNMSAENKHRAMHEGPITECRDSLEILYARVQRFLDMEAQLKRLADADTRSAKPEKKPPSGIAVAMATAFASRCPSEMLEVPASERRFAAPATPAAAQLLAPPVGLNKGVGGVIEALQKKYCMQKGERAHVLSETKELWKIEGERTVPKTHCNQGWRWILENPASRQAVQERMRRLEHAEGKPQILSDEESTTKIPKRPERTGRRERYREREEPEGSRVSQSSSSRSSSSARHAKTQSMRKDLGHVKDHVKLVPKASRHGRDERRRRQSSDSESRSRSARKRNR